MSKRIASPSAAPVNSARSVAIAIASAWIQRNHVTGRGKRSRADLGQVLARRDPELRRQRLDDHRHQVRSEHDPQERVAELGAGRRCSSRSCPGRRRRRAAMNAGPRNGSSAATPRRSPGERPLGRLEHAGLARKRVLDADDAALGRLCFGRLFRRHVTPMPLGELARDGVLRFPDAHRERAAERLGGAQLDLLAGHERELRQVAQQLVVAVRDAFDRGLVARLEARERPQARAVEAELRVGDRVAVRVVRRVAERAVDPRLELLGQRVLEPVGLGVHLVQARARAPGRGTARAAGGGGSPRARRARRPVSARRRGTARARRARARRGASPSRSPKVDERPCAPRSPTSSPRLPSSRSL